MEWSAVAVFDYNERVLVVLANTERCGPSFVGSFWLVDATDSGTTNFDNNVVCLVPAKNADEVSNFAGDSMRMH